MPLDDGTGLFNLCLSGLKTSKNPELFQGGINLFSKHPEEERLI
jgi:hypothetical protein